jgi:hypothetical protein
MLRVFLFQSLAAEQRCLLIATQKITHSAKLAEYRQIETSVRAAIGRFPYETLKFGLAHEELYLEWLAGFLESTSGAYWRSIRPARGKTTTVEILKAPAALGRRGERWATTEKNEHAFKSYRHYLQETGVDPIDGRRYLCSATTPRHPGAVLELVGLTEQRNTASAVSGGQAAPGRGDILATRPAVSR